MPSLRFKGLSLLWRILLSTSIAITALFALTGWTVQSYARRVSEHSLEEEVHTSLQAYQAVWAARTHTLAAVSRVISSMSDVRAAFMTQDQATIRDTAGQLWSEISEQGAMFLVLDPTGNVIASLGGNYPDLAFEGAYLHIALQRFPNQVAGYLAQGQHLYYVVLTPVYVQAASGQALLNMLLVAFDIGDKLASDLKESTYGSDFSFASEGRIIASTIPHLGARDLTSGRDLRGGVRRAVMHGTDYLLLGTNLLDIDNRPVGQLYVIRSFVGPQRVLAELQRNVALIWLFAIVLGFGLTYLLARRILEPVQRLDYAAGEVIKRHYEYRVPVEGSDELARLAQTFNVMCDSIRSAHEDLIRQERIATIGRLSTSIVHDLRNPLAAIYGGAEMLVDADLSPEQSKRLALNIYNASSRIRKLLQDLSEVARARGKAAEICQLADIVKAAAAVVAREADLQRVSITIDVPNAAQVNVERERLERVFLNLINNALEAMPEGGSLHIAAEKENDCILVRVEDSGPGLAAQARATLFQPFSSFGKRNGFGLGLALSRQTVLEHGGDLWADDRGRPGACFLLRLPLAAPLADAGVRDGAASLRPSNGV
ncbi:MAG: HAMP domain-containing protein [Acidobacteriaceae bacterium]|nr:HAMP domain-containing protein [Acidobacteriaceae bacterium]